MSGNKTEVWFGEMEFGSVGFGAGNVSRIAIVHSINEKKYLDPQEVEAHANGSDYLIPAEFEGDIVYSRTFLRGLAW